MRRFLLMACFICLCIIRPASAQSTAPVQLVLDTSEVEQALRILGKEASHQAVTQEDWKELFATTPYQWLKEREAAMGRPFTDQVFEQFLLSPETLNRRTEWEHTLAELKQANITNLGMGVLAWLPTGATIQARVFPEIKPLHNSFVWTKPDQGPAIFLYLERQTKTQFENKVSHECHHIGLASLKKQQEAIQAGMSPNLKKAMEWLTGFGEGEAMLAAAGSPDRHPHWEDDAVVRARWDSDMMHFNSDLQSVQQFLMDILEGKLASDAEMEKRAEPFFGYQGAWYTVGYEMAALVEKQYGRSAFNECLLDPRKLLTMYNRIAVEANGKGAGLATWSPELLTKLTLQR